MVWGWEYGFYQVWQIVIEISSSHLLPIYIQASYLMSWYLIFCFCKIEKMIVSSIEGCENQVRQHSKRPNPGPGTERKCPTDTSYIYSSYSYYHHGHCTEGTGRTVSASSEGSPMLGHHGQEEGVLPLLLKRNGGRTWRAGFEQLWAATTSRSSIRNIHKDPVLKLSEHNKFSGKQGSGVLE